MQKLRLLKSQNNKRKPRRGKIRQQQNSIPTAENIFLAIASNLFHFEVRTEHNRTQNWFNSFPFPHRFRSSISLFLFCVHRKKVKIKWWFVLNFTSEIRSQAYIVTDKHPWYGFGDVFQSCCCHIFVIASSFFCCKMNYHILIFSRTGQVNVMITTKYEIPYLIL